jgi:hypothetical protein
VKETSYAEVIHEHVLAFETGDKQVWDKLLKNYQGKFHTENTGDSESALLVTSVNIIYAVMETALASLLPANPAITANATNPIETPKLAAAETFTNKALEACAYRRQMELFVFDAVLYGRGIVKTAWDTETDWPVAQHVEAGSVFFDLLSRDPKNFRYWFESTVVTEEEFQARVKAGKYSKKVAKDASPTVYPNWMVKQVGNDGIRNRLRNYRPWYNVFEVYDVEAGRLAHVLEGFSEPLMTDGLVYVPYDRLALTENGEDGRGLSEIALISPNQEEVNHLLTYWLNIVRACVPKGVFDPSALDEEQFAKAAQAGLATWSPVGTRGGKTFQESLAEFPVPRVPPEALALLDKVWGNINFVSALAEAQRGQVTGARTATELALIEGQLRNRLSPRKHRIDAITESVAQKMLLLMQRYKTKKEVLQITGQAGWTPLKPADLTGVKTKFSVVPYDPVESNKAVVQEKFLTLLSFLINNSEVDQRNLLKAVIEIFDNPTLRKYNILKAFPVEEALPAGAGGGPPSGVGVQAASDVPPSTLRDIQMEAISNAQLGSAAMESPLIPGPGVPAGMPQLV